MIVVLNKNANGNIELTVEQLYTLLEKVQENAHDVCPLIVEPWKPKEGTHFQVVIKDDEQCD